MWCLSRRRATALSVVPSPASPAPAAAPKQAPLHPSSRHDIGSRQDPMTIRSPANSCCPALPLPTPLSHHHDWAGRYFWVIFSRPRHRKPAVTLLVGTFDRQKPSALLRSNRARLLVIYFNSSHCLPPPHQEALPRQAPNRAGRGGSETDNSCRQCRNHTVMVVARH